MGTDPTKCLACNWIGLMYFTLQNMQSANVMTRLMNVVDIA